MFMKNDVWHLQSIGQHCGALVVEFMWHFVDLLRHSVDLLWHSVDLLWHSVDLYGPLVEFYVMSV